MAKTEVKTVSVKVCPGYSLEDGEKQYLPGESLELDETAAEDLAKRGIVALDNLEQPSADEPAGKKAAKKK